MSADITNFGSNDAINAITSTWHRGTAIAVTSSMSIDEQLTQSGLDWTVETSAFRYGDKYQYRQTETRAAFRSDNGMFIDVYTDRQPWQNRDILEHFHSFCDDAGLSVSHIGALQDGKSLFAAAKLTVNDVLKSGDITEHFLLLRDSHLNGKGLNVSVYSNRCVCTNGMHSAVKQHNKVISHVGEFNSDKVTGILEAAIATVQEKTEQAEQLAQTSLSIEEATIQLIAAFGDASKKVEEQPKIVQTVLNLFRGQAKGSELLTAYNTAYGLLNAVTEYYNWHAPQRGSNQTQFNSILAGSRAKNMATFERQLVGCYLAD